MAKTIASDLAPLGITVNDIAPGPIMTDRITEIFSARAQSSNTKPDELLRRLRRRFRIGGWDDPRRSAISAPDLCSLQAGYLTGQTIVVDGGSTAPSEVARRVGSASPPSGRGLSSRQSPAARIPPWAPQRSPGSTSFRCPQHIGAEIRGVDLRDQLDAETAGDPPAWLDHCVLCSRPELLRRRT